MLPRIGSSIQYAYNQDARQGAVPWYWRLLAAISSLCILGGFLMLSITFTHDSQLRASSQAIGIFAVALLVAGLSITGFLTFAVRDPSYQADAVYIPALLASLAGLLTVAYDFIISKRYYWNAAAYLTIAVAALCTIAYAGLLVYTQTRTTHNRPAQALDPVLPSSQREATSMERLVPRYQEDSYYDNYIRNMYPASTPPTPVPQVQPQPASHPPQTISEEEMQRQQLLMLLLQRDPIPPHNASQSTFHIDWQMPQQYDSAPDQAYYAPTAPSAASELSAIPISAISRSWTLQSGQTLGSLQPWDGVWRTPVVAPMQTHARGRAQSAESREARRRQIETGG